MSVVISLLMVIALFHQSLTYYKVGLFHSTECCFYYLLARVSSITNVTPSLRLMLNHLENCGEFIIAMTSLSWDGHHLLSNYSIIVKLVSLLPLFSSDTTVLNPPSSKKRLVY